ncbi:MAG: DUF2461 domain-containing protein [Acidobacteriota bacterium]
MAQPHFSPELFEFLRELAENNNRDWFQANKSRYEDHVRDPMLQLISDFGGPLRKISRSFMADPRKSGGSLFRIYRDTRFSKNKTPYKTNVAAYFKHKQAKDVHAPGFYLSLSPGEIFAGTGIWHPDSPTLKKIREAIVDQPVAWKRCIGGKAFKSTFELGGESLKRGPKGFDPEHPLIEDLKRKDFVGITTFEEADALAPDFLDRYAAACRAGAPLTRFLTRALELDW